MLQLCQLFYSRTVIEGAGPLLPRSFPMISSIITSQSALSGDANDTAGRASTSIASLLALLAVTLAKVIGTGVDDKSPAEDALGADQLDELVADGALGVALTVSLVVAQVTYMAHRVGWGAVGLVLGVDCSCQRAVLGKISLPPRQYSGRADQRLTVRAGRGAAVGVVAKSVNVHATLSVGIVAGDVPADGRLGILGSLLKGDGARDLGVSTEDGNCVRVAC